MDDIFCFALLVTSPITGRSPSYGCHSLITDVNPPPWKLPHPHGTAWRQQSTWPLWPNNQLGGGMACETEIGDWSTKGPSFAWEYLILPEAPGCLWQEKSKDNRCMPKSVDINLLTVRKTKSLCDHCNDILWTAVVIGRWQRGTMHFFLKLDLLFSRQTYCTPCKPDEIPVTVPSCWTRKEGLLMRDWWIRFGKLSCFHGITSDL